MCVCVRGGGGGGGGVCVSVCVCVCVCGGGGGGLLASSIPIQFVDIWTGWFDEVWVPPVWVQHEDVQFACYILPDKFISNWP